MKPFIVIFLIGLFYLAGIPTTTAQKITCQGNSYSSKIISQKVVSETCVEYEIKVSYDGSRSFGLSHLSVGIPCGVVKNVSNSENWKQVFGKDPTTGIYGLKIDDIKRFGENGADSFTIKFTWCSEGTCDKKLGAVAYKAGQCIDYGTLKDGGNESDEDKNKDDDNEDKSSCGNPSHDHSKTGGGKDSSCGNDGKEKDRDKDGNGKDKDEKDKGDKGGCGNPSHDHSKDGGGKDSSCGNDGKDKDGKDRDGNGKDKDKDKDDKGSCGNPSHDHSKDGSGKDDSCGNNGKDKDKDDGKDKDDKGGCGNPSHDHSKDGGGKDSSCGNDGKDKDDDDKDNKGDCGNPSHDHSKGGSDKDDSCGNGNDGSQKPTCDGNRFSSEIIGKKIVSPTCIDYEIKVSYDGTRAFGLSHYSIGIPCGEVINVSNSENWKQVFGKDPTTGVYGLKIDDIDGFGGNGADSFTIKFTWCSDASCDKKLGIVSYKAGQCVDYDNLPDDGDGDPGDGDSGGGGTGDGDGGDTDGGDGDGGTGGGGTDGGDGGGGTDGGGDTGGDNTCSTLLAGLQKVNAGCSGGNTGQLQVIIQDGLEPYTYAWSTGETTSSIQNLQEGNYEVTVTDANGNTMTLSEIISATSAIVISEAITNPSCNGFTNGAINLTVSGGSAPYSYAWSNGSTQQNIANAVSGSYTVMVTDAVGCTSQKTFTLTNTTAITVGVLFTHPLCSQNNGIIDITPNGGVAPYTYLWSTGATTQDLLNGGPGTYTVKITDATGCSVNMVYALRINNTMVLKYTVTPTSCVDDSSGTINLTVTGGISPYTYLWQDGITTEDRIGLKTGLYKVTVTDAGGCVSSININVFKKTFMVNSEIIQPKCAGDLGSVTVTPVDGISPYTYSWSNGDNDNSISGVNSGNYSVTIADASGCSVTMVFVITSPITISSTSTVTNVQCGSEGAYTIDLAVSGGKSPYTYVWSNEATTQDLSGLNSGTYSVQITDTNGCRITNEIIVNPSPVSWACLINQPTTEVVCKSAGNLLSTSVLEASSYVWTVTSSDNSWAITAGGNSSTMVYTSGTAGVSATFTLTITKDGCTKTCVYTTSTSGCVEKDNTGGGDPSTGDPCAADNTSATAPVNQEPQVSVDETTTETSAGTQTESSDETEDKSSDELTTEPTDENTITELKVSAYPNPFTDRINFEWTSPVDDYVQVEIMDLLGRRAGVLFSGNVRKGQSYNCNWIPTGTDRIYIYRYNSSKNVAQGKLYMKQ